jgi:hypothetical protein
MFYNYDLFRYESAERLRKASKKQLVRDAQRVVSSERPKG